MRYQDHRNLTSVSLFISVLERMVCISLNTTDRQIINHKNRSREIHAIINIIRDIRIQVKNITNTNEYVTIFIKLQLLILGQRKREGRSVVTLKHSLEYFGVCCDWQEKHYIWYIFYVQCSKMKVVKQPTIRHCPLYLTLNAVLVFHPNQTPND